MKLRNKKTGEIWGNAVIESYLCVEGYRLIVKVNKDASLGKHYDSLSALNEEWEDYKPAEPLIKDPKIRKFVREWATFNKIEKAWIKRMEGKNSWFKIYGQDEAMCYWMIEIHAPYSKTVSKDYRGDSVNIPELCGEEENNEITQ